MKLGNKEGFLCLLLLIFFNYPSSAEDKITSTPLINLEKIKPSFEDLNDDKVNLSEKRNIKERKEENKDIKTAHATLIGLDKITAESSKLIINLDEIKKFGPLEIKILKCGKVKVNHRIDDVAYMQVKDLTKNEDDKVFIFNGWTFASDPSLTPFDHAIYDLQLLNCYNV